MTTPHDRLRARIAEALGIYPAEQDVDAILRACLEAAERLPRHAGNRCVDVTDLRALFQGRGGAR